MHIEVQVALNFVISYLYNKLPRRRVNIFGEELEKALKDKFQGHWYPDKPFKGSAFRCLKTGDPIDAVLHRAARESGVPISDILENLPAELSVWVDPGEVSYRIGEKGAVKILFSELNDHRSDDTTNADREVTKTFNPEAQCFRPIDAISTSLSAISLSPKVSPQNSPPMSESSPAAANNYIKVNSPANTNSSVTASANNNGNGNTTTNSTMGGSNSFLPRSQATLTFTTATFAQTKFGSTKLKTNSKRTNSRMSPTEFSNYIKQRAMQQQLHHSHSGHSPAGNIGPIGPVSPSRSLSPNPLSSATLNSTSAVHTNLTNSTMQDTYYFPGPNNAAIGSNLYSPQQQFGPNNFSYSNGFGPISSSFLDSNNFYNVNAGPQQHNNLGAIGTIGTSSGSQNGKLQLNSSGMNASKGAISPQAQSISPGSASNSMENTSSSGSKLLDGINSFYSSQGPYQHLLVAN